METETTTRIHNLIILDRSGSMCSIRDAAVSHLNECLQAIKSAQKEFAGQIKFVKFNVDHQQAIAERYKVMSVPSLVLFRDGVAKEKVTGIYPKDRLAHYFARKTAE